jgi:hypothetical protein
LETVADGDLGAQKGEFLAQVKPLTKLRHRALALASLLQGGRPQEPCGQGILASARAGSAQQLEQAARSKDIKVGGIGVVVVAEAQSRLAATRPALLQTGEPPLIKLNRVPDTAPRPAGPVPPKHEDRKDDCRRRQKQRQKFFFLA